MTKRGKYNTKIRKLVMEFLETKSNITVSIQDIISFIEGKGIQVSHTTVYRYLNKLEKEKIVIRIKDNQRHRSVYQISPYNSLCDQHLHIKCTNCGKLIHLNCSLMDDIRHHLLESHSFQLNCCESVLYGVCDECAKK